MPTSEITASITIWFSRPSVKAAILLPTTPSGSGHIADPAYDRDAQTRALRRFNDLVAADAAMEKLILPVRDGITLIYKKP